MTKGLIVGVDEVGYGAWAGPVVAAAVAFDPQAQDFPDNHVWHSVRDSKTLTKQARSRLSMRIRAAESRMIWGVGWASCQEIGQVGNLLTATFQAMRRAIERIGKPIEHVYIDGRNRPSHWPWPVTCVVKGDQSHPVISAASIVAKVYRDTWMTCLGFRYPVYGWDRNKGYGTAYHRQAIEKYGWSNEHRPLRCRLLDSNQ